MFHHLHLCCVYIIHGSGGQNTARCNCELKIILAKYEKDIVKRLVLVDDKKIPQN